MFVKGVHMQRGKIQQDRKRSIIERISLPKSKSNNFINRITHQELILVPSSSQTHGARHKFL